MSAEAQIKAPANSDLQSVSAMLAYWDQFETWVTIERHPDYQVSSWGNVRRGDRILRPGKAARYWVVSLSTDGKTITARIHRLVIEAFIGVAPFDGAIAAHNDGNTANNRVINLRWASALENQADRIRHGTRTRGSEVFGAKLVEDSIPLIRRRIADGERYPAIAKDFGVSISTISLINRQRIWTHV